jgi:hypothetical protein
MYHFPVFFTQFLLFYDVQCNLRLKALERETKLYA